MKEEKCCSENSQCNWAVGYNRPGYLPDNHVEHFENWYDAANAWADVAYIGGCTNDLILENTKIENKDIEVCGNIDGVEVEIFLVYMGEKKQ